LRHRSASSIPAFDDIGECLEARDAMNSSAIAARAHYLVVNLILEQRAQTTAAFLPSLSLFEF